MNRIQQILWKKIGVISRSDPCIVLFAFWNLMSQVCSILCTLFGIFVIQDLIRNLYLQHRKSFLVKNPKLFCVFPSNQSLQTKNYMVKFIVTAIFLSVKSSGLVTYCGCFGQHTQQKEIKDGRVYLAHSLRVQSIITEVMAAGVWGKCLYTYSQEAEKDEHWCSAPFLLPRC